MMLQQSGSQPDVKLNGQDGTEEGKDKRLSSKSKRHSELNTETQHQNDEQEEDTKTPFETESYDDLKTETQKQEDESEEVTKNASYGNSRDTSSGNSQDVEESDRPGFHLRTIKHMLSVYAAKTSINGVPFISNTKYTSVRVIWGFIFIFAVIAMCVNLLKLVTMFFEYGTQTKLDLNFSYVAFPAVTICNVNPVRMSTIWMASDKVKRVATILDPSILLQLVEEWKPVFKEHYEKVYSGGRILVRERHGSFLDSINISEIYSGPSSEPTDTQIIDPRYMNSWEGSARESVFDKVKEDLVYLYTAENGTTRFRMGHQIVDMIVHCSFNGRICQQADFTFVASSVYGNCYTLQNDKFMVRKSGTQQGLQLIIYLETHEYVPGITTSKGIQVVVHETGTIPFPDNEGVSASAGMSTFLALRLIDQSKQSYPYGNCQRRSEFRAKYNTTYTRQKLLLHEMVMEVCNCFDGSTTALNKLLNVSRSIRICNTKNDLACLYLILWSFSESVSGSCPSPCTDTVYRKSIATLGWPNPDFGRVIAASLCKQNEDLCDILNNKTDDELKEEFVKLTVFFDDLNHEVITEDVAYPFIQFISDIGGTIGLWIGMSALSVFELVHLLLALFRYLSIDLMAKIRTLA